MLPMNDPTQLDNLPSIFNRIDMVVTSVSTVVQVFPAGTFHNRQGLNAAGEIIYISPWGPGASGVVNGY